MDIPVLLHACERCHTAYAIPQQLVARKPVLHCSARACGGELRAMRDAPDLNEGWMYREVNDEEPDPMQLSIPV
jgi:hypothetical protein